MLFIFYLILWIECGTGTVISHLPSLYYSLSLEKHDALVKCNLRTENT